MTAQRNVNELVPLADRTRWMLVCRSLLVGVLFAIGIQKAGWHLPPVLWAALGWLAVSALLSLALRAARGVAMVAFTVALLGDGLLLAAAWYQFGGLAGQVGYVIVLHGVAVTLLASFRTGAKLALWHSLLALVVAEAVGSGVLHPGGQVSVAVPLLALYLGILWAGVLATASLAAVNERELRRRRYDSEILRQFGLALSDERDGVAVARMLAGFGRDELLGSRVAVLVQPTAEGQPVVDAAYAVLTGQGIAGDVPAVHRLTTDVTTGDVVRRAIAGRGTVLAGRLDAARDPGLAALLPDAHNLVVVPFSLNEVRGALVVEHPRRSSQRRSQRVERRMLATAEQATAHASMAIDRAILTERIRAAAEVDGLTQVANRRRFDTALEQAVARGAASGGGQGFALVMVDLDHFKRLNDTHGHQTGDEVLRIAARAIKASCRDGDLAARYGGEEFAVIVDAADEAGALAAAERIWTAIRTADAPVQVTASVGVAVFPAHGADGTHLLAAADTALYAAKSGGRDRVELSRGRFRPRLVA